MHLLFFLVMLTINTEKCMPLVHEPHGGHADDSGHHAEKLEFLDLFADYENDLTWLNGAGASSGHEHHMSPADYRY
jgi:hypothetical protein